MQRRVRANRNLAPSSQRRQHRPFGRDRDSSFNVFQAPADLARFTGIVSSLHCQRSLTNRGTHHLRIQQFRDAVLPTQAPQPGRGQNDRVVLTFVQLSQTRIQVAANVGNLQVRPHDAQLRRSPQRRRADARASSEVRQPSADDGIPRVLALRYRRQNEASRQIGRHVFQAVDRQVDRAVQQRLFDFLGEEPLGPDFRQRHVEDFVASGVDNLQTRLDTEALQSRLDPARLPQSELRTPRADGQHANRSAEKPFGWC